MTYYIAPGPKCRYVASLSRDPSHRHPLWLLTVVPTTLVRCDVHLILEVGEKTEWREISVWTEEHLLRHVARTLSTFRP